MKIGRLREYDTAMVLVLAAFLGMASLPQPEDYSLHWSPKLGQAMDYKLSATGKADDDQHEQEAKLHVVVKGSLDSHGYAILCDETGITRKSEGDDAETPPDVTGVWLESESDEDPDAEKLEDFSTTVGVLVANFGDKRRKVGDSWQIPWGGELQQYKFVGLESVSGTQACKVTMSTGPADNHEDDTFWIRTTDAMLLRVEEHTTGKDKDEDGKEYSYDETNTMQLSGETTYSTAPTTEDLALLAKMTPQVKCLSALTNPAQYVVGNYAATVHEYRDLRVFELKPKQSIDGMITDALPKNATIELEVSKDGKHVSASIMASKTPTN